MDTQNIAAGEVEQEDKDRQERGPQGSGNVRGSNGPEAKFEMSFAGP